MLVALGKLEGSRVRERDLPACRQVGGFETKILTTRKNLKSLMDVPGKWIDRVRQGRSWDKLVLDVTRGAPGVGQTYGRRERTP